MTLECSLHYVCTPWASAGRTVHDSSGHFGRDDSKFLVYQLLQCSTKVCWWCWYTFEISPEKKSDWVVKSGIRVGLGHLYSSRKVTIYELESIVNKILQGKTKELAGEFSEHLDWATKWQQRVSVQNAAEIAQLKVSKWSYFLSLLRSEV